MKSWYDIYLEEISHYGGEKHYITSKVRNKKKMINMILSLTKKTDRILEAGCGTGIISTYISEKGFDVTGIDIEDDILQLAKKIASEYSNTNRPKFEQKSILKLDYPKNYFKVSFSSGVLEHFSDEEIVLTLKQQLFISEFVIVSIPTDYFEDSEAMHGDERFMSIKKWRELITRANGTILKEANCHYLNFPYHYVIPKKWFKPWPYRIFLIKS